MADRHANIENAQHLIMQAVDCDEEHAWKILAFVSQRVGRKVADLAQGARDSAEGRRALVAVAVTVSRDPAVATVRRRHSRR